MNNVNITDHKNVKRYWRNYKISFFVVLIGTLAIINQVSTLAPIDEHGDAGVFITTIIILPIASLLIGIMTARSCYKLSSNKKSLSKGLFGLRPFPFPVGPFFAFFCNNGRIQKSCW